MIKLEDHKVTIGLKVTKTEKLETIRIAEQYEMNVSQYLSSLLRKSNVKMNKLQHLPDELIIAPEKCAAIQQLVQQVQKRYPKRDFSDIVLAALTIALENENLYTINKFKKYLK